MYAEHSLAKATRYLINQVYHNSSRTSDSVHLLTYICCCSSQTFSSTFTAGWLMKRNSDNFDFHFGQHPAPMWIMTQKDFAILDANQAAIALLKQKRRKLLAQTFESLFPDDKYRLKTLLRRKSKKYRALGILNYRSPSGEMISLSAHCKQVLYGKINCSIIVANEISSAVKNDNVKREGVAERAKTDLEQIKQKELSNVIINSLPGVFYLFDENGKFLRWNKNFETVTGYSGAEISTMIPLDFFEGNEKDYIFDRISQVFTEGTTQAQADFCTKSKMKIPYHFNGSLIEYEGKRCLIGMGIDITVQKGIEKENQRQKQFLERTARRLELATKSAGLGIFQIDFVNDHWEIDDQLRQIFGVEGKQINSELYWALIHPDERTVKMQRDQVILTSMARQYTDQYRIVRPCDHEIRFIRSQGVILRDESGKAVTGLSVVYDQTKEKIAEQGLVQSLKEKETLIREVHHRIKNNLQLISSIVYLKLGSFKERDIREFLEGLREKIKSISILHERLLQSEKLDAIDMNDYLAKVLRDIQVFYRQDLLMETKTDIARIHLESEAATYCGLIVNELVTNAIKHAFPNRNTGEVTVRLWSDTDDNVVLSVSDNGIGLPPEVTPRENATYGMSLIYIFVRQLRGDWVINRKSGTDFQIRFPVK